MICSDYIGFFQIRNALSSLQVFQAAEEIDPGYVEAQSLMSQILLGGSIVGLAATIALIIPGMVALHVNKLLVDDKKIIHYTEPSRCLSFVQLE